MQSHRRRHGSARHRLADIDDQYASQQISDAIGGALVEHQSVIAAQRVANRGVKVGEGCVALALFACVCTNVGGGAGERVYSVGLACAINSMGSSCDFDADNTHQQRIQQKKG